MYETYGPGTEVGLYRLLASTSTIVGVIDAALAGVVGGLVAKAVGAGSALSLFIGAVVTSVIVVLLFDADGRIIERRASLARAPLRAIGRERRDDDAGHLAGEPAGDPTNS